MSLASGVHLGPYHVTARIGAGGMGEVWRATDTHLGRQVAIKVLPDAFAEDPERLARFEREARTLAALNHPNIATIHGFEKSGGVCALVMELVEGPTLADLIDRRPFEGARDGSRARDEGAPQAPRGAISHGLKIEDALSIARQIADALEAAHEHGIVHRDLKPANIKVRGDGAVKVLDFGLAKALAPEAAGAAGDISHSPTITSPAMTERGVILGTAPYMSPEQARGKPVDRRTDIWAFGCVLFEMLTGRRAFEGEDVSETLAFVLAKEPAWSRLHADVPAHVRSVLERCLQKDPARRFRDIGFARLGLDAPIAFGVQSSPVRRPSLPLLAAGAAATLAAGIAVGWITFGAASRAPAGQQPTTVLVDTLPDARRFPDGTLGTGTLLAVSSDGRRLVYSAVENGQRRLFVRSLDDMNQRAAIPIGEPDAREPFLSPGGDWIGYRVGRTLKRMPVSGGPPQPIATLSEEIGKVGFSWQTDGTILLGSGRTGLQRVPENGGALETLVVPSEGRSIWYPQLLPGGRAVLYTESAERADAGQLRVFDLATRTSKALRAGAAGRYVASGHLVFAANRTMWALPFDLDRLETRGAPVPIVTDIRVDAEGGAVDAVVSDGGTLAYVPATPFHRTLVWVERQSVETALDSPPHPYSNPRVSPDGTRVLVTMRDAGQDVFIWELSRRVLRQVTFDESANNVATWIDDARVAYSGEVPDGSIQIFVTLADGSAVSRQLTEGLGIYPFAASSDGSLLFGTQYPRGGGPPDLAVVPFATPAARRVVAVPEFVERNPAISPDGRWLAYQSNRTGRPEIHVRPFPDLEAGEFQISHENGRWPVWARDGSELHYGTTSAGQLSLHAVTVRPGSPTTWGPPRRLLSGPYSQAGGGDRPYDVFSGRFLLMKDVVASGPSQRHEVVVVLNFLDELTRRVPTGANDRR